MLRFWIKHNGTVLLFAVVAFVGAGLLGWGWHRDVLAGFALGALLFGRSEHPDLWKNADMLRLAVGQFLNIHLQMDRSSIESDAANKSAKLMQYWLLKFSHVQSESSFGGRPTKAELSFLEAVEREVMSQSGTTNPDSRSLNDR